MLIINGLRTKVQSVDKITNQANRGGIHKGIHRALRFWGGVRGVVLVYAGAVPAA